MHPWPPRCVRSWPRQGKQPLQAWEPPPAEPGASSASLAPSPSQYLSLVPRSIPAAASPPNPQRGSAGPNKADARLGA